MYDLGKLAFQT